MWHLILLGTSVLFLNSPEITQAVNIDSEVSEKLAAGEKVSVVVSFNEGVKSVLEKAKSKRSEDPGLDSNGIVEALQKHAETTQAGLLESLSLSGRSASGFEYTKSYWTSNRLFVKEADSATVQTISENPEVSRIQVAPTLQIPEDRNSQIQSRSDFPELPPKFWNHDRIGLCQAWVELDGGQGEGVVVAAIDSGVKHNHNQLIGGFRGDYGWFDGVLEEKEPVDLDGHGTFVMGILAGKEIGVAPGVTWMTCRACHEGCSYEAMMNCINFISCPTLPDGSEPDCSKRPDILNFSIGGPDGGEAYLDDFQTMSALGIIIVAAAGNSGPDCATIGPPATLPVVLTVGATHFLFGNDTIMYGSSYGPAADGTIKPDLMAPGVALYSANSPTDDPDELRFDLGGTSYAAPHVAGVVALLHVRDKEISFEEVYGFLTTTAHPEVGVEEQEGLPKGCEEDLTVVPNNLFGFGRLDAAKALQAQTKVFTAKK